jgi:hypothetical protein
MSESLAKGAALTPESFADFIARLKHWNDGEGVSDHCTANPVFMVEKLVPVFGIDRDYTDEYAIYCHEDEQHWLSTIQFMCDMAEENPDVAEKIEAESKADYGCCFDELSEGCQLEIICNIEWVSVVGYAERWEPIGAHLTKEAAQAFIDRKGHDYRDGLRIYVESSCYGWEFNTIIRALIDGRLVLKEDEK